MPRPQVVILVALACKGGAKPSAEVSAEVPAEVIEVPGGAVDAGVGHALVLDAAATEVSEAAPHDAGASRVGRAGPKGGDAPKPDGEAKPSSTTALTLPGKAEPAVVEKHAAPTSGAPPGQQASEATKQRAKDPRNHLQPEQGTLSVGKVAAKVGASGAATIEVKPAAGWHVSTEYTTKLWLEAPAGVTIEKWLLTAGGKRGRGDATTLSEQALVFSVQATPQTAGTFALTGVLTFGICERDSCHPKTQAITIQVAAN